MAPIPCHHIQRRVPCARKRSTNKNLTQEKKLSRCIASCFQFLFEIVSCFNEIHPPLFNALASKLLARHLILERNKVPINLETNSFDPTKSGRFKRDRLYKSAEVVHPVFCEAKAQNHHPPPHKKPTGFLICGQQDTGYHSIVLALKAKPGSILASYSYGFP